MSAPCTKNADLFCLGFAATSKKADNKVQAEYISVFSINGNNGYRTVHDSTRVYRLRYKQFERRGKLFYVEVVVTHHHQALIKGYLIATWGSDHEKQLYNG